MKIASDWRDELVTVPLLHTIVDSNNSFHFIRLVTAAWLSSYLARIA